MGWIFKKVIERGYREGVSFINDGEDELGREIGIMGRLSDVIMRLGEDRI